MIQPSQARSVCSVASDSSAPSCSLAFQPTRRWIRCSFSPVRSVAACNTSIVASVISGPIPSPARTPILNSRCSAISAPLPDILKTKSFRIARAVAPRLSPARTTDVAFCDILADKNNPVAGHASMSDQSPSKSANLRVLIHRRDEVLAVMHPPTAAHARIMEKAGCEALFVGTGGVVGAYTGLSDVGTATMTECVTIAGWIADSVSIPVIIDGDTGHGGIMAVRRMVRECIRAGIAGIRIDDQPIESKRATQSAGVEVVPLDQAIARYRAAVDTKKELDPNFAVMAQCYARDASNGTLEDTIAAAAGLP